MQRALDHAQNMSGSGSDRSCRLRAELAMLQSDAGQHAEALGLLRSVMEWNSREKGPEAPLTVGNMIDLGQCLSWAELPAEACELLEAALPLSRKVFSPQHPKTISALCSLTRALSQSGRTEEALSAGREGLELSLAVHGEAHSKTFELMTSLAETLAGMGRDQEALLMAEKCLTISRKVHGDPHRTTAFAAADLAVILEKTGRTDDAIRVLQESVLPSPWCLSAKFQLGNALYGRRRYEEALVAFQEAQKGYPEGARAVELERMLMLTQEMLNKAAVPKNTEPTNLPK